MSDPAEELDVSGAVDLCQPCHDMLSRIPDEFTKEDLIFNRHDLGRAWEDKGTLHTTHQSLLKSSENCAICARLVLLIPKDYRATDTASPVTWEMYPNTQDLVNVERALRKEGLVLNLEGTVFSAYYCILFTTRKRVPSIYAPVLAPNTGSERSHAVATKWLEECLHKHSDKCCRFRRNSVRPWTPSRLLDLGPSDGTSDNWGESPSNQDIVLRDRQNCSAELPYFTLSHCWGQVVPIRLLRSNIDAFRHNIPLESLPRTFRDAVAVTRRFKIRYLWIDSLCIIQDSKEDWRRESAIMGDVYSSALCNIAAAGADDSNQGLFHSSEHRRRRWLDPLEFQVLSSEGANRRFLLVEYRRVNDDFIRSKLFQRAWVLQERLLSPRVLYFGKDQIYWECGSRLLRESFPKRFNDGKSGRYRHLKMMGSWKWLGGWKSSPDLPSWEDLVWTYNSCDISEPRDKLPALSGIAKAYGTGSKSDYLAGLWRPRLMMQLHWFFTQPGRRIPEFEIPSWSWASCSGSPIIAGPQYEPDEDLATIIAASTNVVGGDPTGQVRGGELSLRGRRLQCGFRPKFLNAVGAPGINAIVRFSEGAFYEQHSCFLEFDDRGDWTGFEDCIKRAYVDKQNPSLEECYAGVRACLPFRDLSVLPMTFQEERRKVRALLLTAVEDQTGGSERFQRVGLVTFSLLYNHVWMDMWKEKAEDEIIII